MTYQVNNQVKMSLQLLSLWTNKMQIKMRILKWMEKIVMKKRKNKNTKKLRMSKNK